MYNLEKVLGDLKNDGLESTSVKSSYHKIISQIQERIHSQIPKVDYKTHEAATQTNIREEIFNGVNYQRAVLFLLSNGCEWALKNAHGCIMCGHIARQARRKEMISTEDYLSQFEDQFEKIDFRKYPLLNLFNNGSFLNDNEIPADARREMLMRINAKRDIKMLVLETRPEFVSASKIKEIKRLVPDKHVEIAMGLEIKDDLYRTVCINKGFSLEQYDEASRIIVRHMNLRTYVLLKPPFLTEKESIEEAVKTIEHAFKKKSGTVSLEACTVQDFTLVNELYKRGLYTPPWLWSIVEVVKRCKGPGKLIVGLFQFYPSPGSVPYNCERCSQSVLEAIKKYNRTLDTDVFNGLTCDCKKEMEKILKEVPLPFKKRLEISMDKLQSDI
jgi:radical SAM enzyme (TIGR01210 family)